MFEHFEMSLHEEKGVVEDVILEYSPQSRTPFSGRQLD